ncbi:MAG: hypothetical protein J1E62_01540 [Lachnospiraceae bacterium]|nr:hypothetical protein [Lachnospiraceae bacterium]
MKLGTGKSVNIFDKLAYIRDEKIKTITNTTSEILWREIFKDTVKGYDWYTVKSLSLGRWAIGYNYAYVLARVLEGLKPKSILELGLGQSSKIINSYVAYQKNKHTINYEVVEQSKEWLQFFLEDNSAEDNIIVHQREIEQKRFNNKPVNVYSGFGSVVKNKKYSLISIDGPKGSNYISRIDVLPFITNILEEDFVIMIDDYNRMGEKRMATQIEKRLQEANIKFFTGIYKSQCDVYVICSSNWQFFTTL